MGEQNKHLIAAAFLYKNKFFLGSCHAAARDKMSNEKNPDAVYAKSERGYIDSCGKFILEDDVVERSPYFKSLDPITAYIKPEFLNLEKANKFVENINIKIEAAPLKTNIKTEISAMREFVNASSNYGKDAENPFWFEKD